MAYVTIDAVLCKGCQLCTLQCPKELLYLSEEYNQSGYNVVKQKEGDECVACKLCAYMCPEAAITVYK
ncbi:MAG: ferredoxin family protein [Eubacteriaceae bacterium]|nr:ferredoxin family protein [Eubacteriaceae bacterium]